MKQFKYFKHVGFGVLTLLLIMISTIAIIEDANKDMTNKMFLVSYLVENNTVAIVVLIVVSIMFGFLWSNMSYVQLEKQKKDSKSIVEIVMMFLSSEEKEIMKCLVDSRGETTQAEISRLPGLNRVKAYRSIQKMQKKKLIDVTAHGKIRKIKLKGNLFNILTD